jgi:oligoendopeptidase F
MHVPLGPVPAYSLQNAREIVVEALAPLHGRASRLIDESFDSGWLQDTPGHAGFVADVGPGYHPYIGIDYRGDVLSLLELARLWGVALHRHFSDVAQPDAVAGTWPLLDDTVGTVAELLVLDYLNRNAETEQEGLGWLSVAQDFWYRRFFLPAANADFERTLRDRAAAGDPFPVSWLNQTFDRTLRRVHPASVRDDNAFRLGWAAESGLYSPYGNLRQALATAAAAQLADGLLRKGGTAPTAFRALLAAGRSEPAAVLLAGAGIDLDQDQAFEKVLVASKATISLMTAMVPEFAPETAVNTDPEKHEPARQELLESPQPDAEKPGD